VRGKEDTIHTRRNWVSLCSARSRSLTGRGSLLVILRIDPSGFFSHPQGHAKLTGESSHWQRRRNDATELAHADMTALPKTDTNYTALSLIPTITGNTFAASLRTDTCPQRKGSSSTSHARNPFNLNFFDSAQCLMVRRWRLIGYFPILYNPQGHALLSSHFQPLLG
jgi:hypothetical protein